MVRVVEHHALLRFGDREPQQAPVIRRDVEPITGVDGTSVDDRGPGPADLDPRSGLARDRSLESAAVDPVGQVDHVPRFDCGERLLKSRPVGHLDPMTHQGGAVVSGQWPGESPADDHPSHGAGEEG